MGGWGRLGIVISVFWLVGAPLWAIHDTNTRAVDAYGSCYSGASSIQYPNEADRQRQLDWCHSLLESMQFKWETIRYANESDTGVAALMYFGPLVAFWLVGRTILGTIRWIGRGFRRATR